MAAALPIGTLVDGGGGANLIASKFNRHTFWCGQSGSGKTYALGVVLERLLLDTRLPMVILDPNSDFTRLREVRGAAAKEVADSLRARDIRVLGSADQPLQVRYIDLPVRSKAAVMQMDPVIDAEDFNAALRVDAEMRSVAPTDGMKGRLVEWLRDHDDPAHRRFGMRLENLGIADWNLWAWGAVSACDVIDEAPDAVVLDLGSLAEPGELKAAALAVLDHLWEQRERRVPRLIVIDEAHNLCPPDPMSPVERLLTDRIVQIAAEGRKYGLWLVLSTQRPSKVHPNVVSQCDNVALMRMNSPRDLVALGDVFGFVPEDILVRSTGFAQGQAIFAGGFITHPAVVQVAERFTEEGGSDVQVPLR